MVGAVVVVQVNMNYMAATSGNRTMITSYASS